MTKKLINENVNIDVRPLKQDISGFKEITLGDAHANPINLLHFLVNNGVCDISEENYSRLVEIYKTPQDLLTPELLKEYNRIIEGMAILNHDLLVRLIGDELADRGNNDYFILKILQKLVKGNAKVEILLSNHGVEFIEAYEHFKERGNKFKPTMLDANTHAVSLQALANLVERGLVTAEEIFEIVEQCYKPVLKAISYSLDSTKPGITIYSHAGIGLESVKALAKKFQVDYQDNTAQELAATIDRINERFTTEVYNNSVHKLLNPTEMLNGYCGTITLKEDNVLEFLMWNRKYDTLDRPLEHNGYALSFAHGHDKNEASRDNIHVLDSDLGKAFYMHRGTRLSLLTDEVQLSKLSKDVEAKEEQTKKDDTKPLDDLQEVFDPLLKTKKFKMTFFIEEKEKFLQQLELLDQLSNKLTKKEKRAAKAFHHGLDQASKIYFQNPTPSNYLNFKTTCNSLIDEARSVLDTSCGLKQILGNIALAIIGLGVFYLAAICYNKATTGRFLFFPPAAAHRIDAIETALHQPFLAPPMASI